ncbi:alpha/beta hydrolase [Mycobacterium sp. HM-7]
MTIGAANAELYGEQHVSLTHGWLPITVQALAVAVLLLAIGWRNGRWRTVWLPVAAASGLLLAAAARWIMASQGWSDEPAPTRLWIWTAVTGAAAVLLIVGWHATRWWRRALAMLSVPLCVLSTGLTLNTWVGYFPNLDTAWEQANSAPLPNQTRPETVVAMQKARQIPSKGSVVAVQTGSAASGFKHRDEYVYLPPAWFAGNPPPRLPMVMMIGGEFNTPADWLRAGNAIKTVDDFATAHHGNAPVLVFVDPGGSFNNDTECVNGPRGNSADHLIKDVLPFMTANYGVSSDRRHRGIVGWSMGGTCAVDLTVMHPDLFSAFQDIAGDIAPNAGDRPQTVQRLFGGSTAKYADWDPVTVMSRRTYDDIAAWYDINGPELSRNPLPAQTVAAHSLCGTGSSRGIRCAVVERPGKHDWPFAAQAFAAGLPWLAGQLGTPDVPRQPLPGATAPAMPVEASRR